MSYSYVKTHPDQHYEQRLADFGLAVGDLVLYASGRDETGGIIFRIVEDTHPQKPHSTSKTVQRHRETYDQGSNKWVTKLVDVTEHGYWDANGRKLMDAAIAGFVRIRPTFDFFATRKGRQPKGKGETLIIKYSALRDLKKVDLVLLGAKYIELGNLLRSVAVKNGMDEPTG